MQVKELADRDEAKRFYDERYSEGYMDDWPPEKKLRVLALIASLGLGDKGRALEFGCGNGVFTAIIKQALPGWDVCGTDISAVAVRTAAERYPDCQFYESSDPALRKQKFDLLVTHHVLEHVLNISETWAEMAGMMSGGSHMLHILPCGNEKSLEYELANRLEGGIDAARGNRFFYEDLGHLRRLTTRDMERLARPHGFALAGCAYANQFWGALDWIAGYPPAFVRALTPFRASRAAGRSVKLVFDCALIRLLGIVRRVTTAFKRAASAPNRSTKQWAYLFLLWPFFLLAWPVDAWVKKKARDEWDRHRTEPNGSEMYLALARANMPTGTSSDSTEKAALSLAPPTPV